MFILLPLISSKKLINQSIFLVSCSRYESKNSQCNQNSLGENPQ